MPRKKETTESVRRQLLEPPPRRKPVTDADFLSTGIDALNVAMSGSVNRGYRLGGYAWFVGESESGKSFFCMNSIAVAANDDRFKKYRLVYDNSERSPTPDVRKFFGNRLAGRIEFFNSATVEEFYYRLYELLRKTPCVWVMDSLDALRALADDKKFAEAKGKYDAGEAQGKGSYGTAKARANSQNVGRVMEMLAETNSLLVIVSQVRDRINTPFPMQTYSGGKAIKHFANVQVWTKIKEHFTTKALGKEWPNGELIKVDLHKNRINGYHGTVHVPFYRDFGLDNLGASVRFLADVGYWGAPRKDKTDNGKAEKVKVVHAPEFGVTGTFEEVVQRVRSEEGQPELKQLVQAAWDKIEAACAVKRDNPYE
jgi:RecA/RadA recombinase